MNHALNRFLDAQNADGCFDEAIAEMRDGKKLGHWIWWIFPQMHGLSLSGRGHYFAISDEDEAREYLKHPVLRDRLFLAVEALATRAWNGDSIEDVMGELDAKKVRSCLELFVPLARATDNDICIAIAMKGMFLIEMDRALGGN